ncbi:MAG: hypothetical protein SFU83_22125 [Meiothermus sp.]|nr:hypothetical protein [Meiothermus sp.]
MKKRRISLSEIYFCIAVLCLMSGIVVFSIVWFDQKPNLDSLRAEGKEATGLVWDKYQRGYDCGRAARRRTCYSHILSVRYNVGGKTEIWDLGKLKLDMPVIGSSTPYTRELSVSLERYEAAKLGDRIRLVYLPKDPTIAEETDWVKNWSPWPTLWFCIVALGLGVLFSFLTIRQYLKEKAK